MIRKAEPGQTPPPESESANVDSPADGAAATAEVSFHPELTTFSGPLDLLLYLIHKNEVDILDIPIAEILEQYLEHLKRLERHGLLRLNEAGDFLVMAARLMEIKSRMLLPVAPGEEDEILEEELNDPRLSLVEQLLEYRETKERASLLADVERRRALAYDRPPTELPPLPPDTLELQDTTFWDLCSAFQRVLDEAQLRAESVHVVELEELPMENVIEAIQARFETSEPAEIRFGELFDPNLGPRTLIAYFLAVLEMARLRLLYIRQDAAFEEILITRRVLP